MSREFGRYLTAMKSIFAVFDNYNSQLNPKTQIAIIWSIEDVQSIRNDLTDEQAMEVLLLVKNRHDASIGVNWDTIEYVAKELYPEEI